MKNKNDHHTMVVLLYFPRFYQPSVNKNIDEEINQYRDDDNYHPQERINIQ